jgi:hypothetical protein
MRGRPPFKPTRHHRRRVELMAGEASEEVIAKLIGINADTLRKHFSNELQFGRARVLADNLDRLDRQAAKGNTAAAKALIARKDLVAPDQPPKEPKLGKKEQADADAVEAATGTSWRELTERVH